MLVPPFSVSPQFQTLKISNEKEICFLAVMALYQDEMNLKMKAGLGTLLKKFSQANMSDMVDPSRKSALQPRKRFWLF
jgi:hypothetical protein